MEVIKIYVVDNCSTCPHNKKKYIDTPDSFDNCHSWFCMKENRQIAAYVDTFDKVKVPEWCPFIKQEEQQCK